MGCRVMRALPLAINVLHAEAVREARRDMAVKGKRSKFPSSMIAA